LSGLLIKGSNIRVYILSEILLGISILSVDKYIGIQEE